MNSESSSATGQDGVYLCSWVDFGRSPNSRARLRRVVFPVGVEKRLGVTLNLAGDEGAEVLELMLVWCPRATKETKLDARCGRVCNICTEGGVAAAMLERATENVEC